MVPLTTESEILLQRDGSNVALYFPPGSARGIQSSLDQVYPGELRRTVNGDLIDLTRTQLRKYRLSLSATGQALPDLRNLWRGQLVTVAPPVIWTAYAPAGSATIALERPARAAGWRLLNASTGEPVAGATLSENGLTINLPGAAPAVHLEYQPVLSCRVVLAASSGDEWDASATWSLELEEA